MTMQSHVDSGGKQCPKCGSKAIKATGAPERQKWSSIWDHMFCATCGARWRNIYTLTKAEDI